MSRAPLLDCKRTAVPWELQVIRLDGSVERVQDFRPYFYLIVKPEHAKNAMSLIKNLAIKLLREERNLLVQIIGEDVYDALVAEPVDFIETNYRAWLFNESTQRFEKKLDYVVYKVVLHVPRHVRLVTEPLFKSQYMQRYDMHISGQKIMYIVRWAWDRNERVLGRRPLWITLDWGLLEVLPDIKFLVFDIEKTRDNRYVISVLEDTFFSSKSWDEKKREIETFIIEGPDDPQLEEVRRIFLRNVIWVGYNITGFDIPVLVNELKLFTPEEVEQRCIIDLFEFVSKHAQGLGIGKSDLSLQAVLEKLIEQLALPEELLEIKSMSVIFLKSAEAAVEYNKDDVLDADALMQLLGPMIFCLAAFLQMPISAVLRMRPGQLYELLLFRMYEYVGEIPEARFLFRDESEKLLLSALKTYPLPRLLAIAFKYWDKLSRLPEVADPAEAFKVIIECARHAVKYIVRPEAIKRRLSKGRKRAGEEERLYMYVPVQTRVLDFSAQYPSTVDRFYIGPECYVGGFAEDAVFDAIGLPSLFYSLNKRLMNFRLTAKNLAKTLSKLSEEDAKKYMREVLGIERDLPVSIVAAMLDAMQSALKALINAEYGAMGQSSSPVFLGNPHVSLAIFHKANVAQLTVLFYALTLGLVPFYSDTDSVWIAVPPYGAKLGDVIKSLKQLKIPGLKTLTILDFLYGDAASSNSVNNLYEIKLEDSKILRTYMARVFLEKYSDQGRCKLCEEALPQDDPEAVYKHIVEKHLDVYMEVKGEAAERALVDFAALMGYELSPDKQYDDVLLYSSKGYVARKLHKTVTIKGPILTRLKALASPYLRRYVKIALRDATVDPLIEAILNAHPLLLVTSLSRRPAEIFLLDPDRAKRMSEEEKMYKLRVRIRDNFGNKLTGYLKCLRPRHTTDGPRLAALMLNYGWRSDKYPDTWIFDFESSNLNLLTIADLRAVMLVKPTGGKRSEYPRGERLTGTYALVLVTNPDRLGREDYRAYIVKLGRDSKYILRISGEWKLLPTDFSRNQAVREFIRKLNEEGEIAYFGACTVSLQVVSEIRDELLLRYLILQNMRNYLWFYGLDLMLPDFKKIDEKLRELKAKLSVKERTLIEQIFG